MKVDNSEENKKLAVVESELRQRVQKEEAEYDRNSKPSNSLWGHSERVVLLAERIGRAEGINPIACRLAGIFHDAGKFGGGSYHNGDEPEEKRSVAALRDITRGSGLEPALIDQVEESILQLYREDPEPAHLTRVVFDADSLDMLIAFEKAGILQMPGNLHLRQPADDGFYHHT